MHHLTSQFAFVWYSRLQSLKISKNHLSTPSNIDLIRFFCSVYNPRLTKNCNRYHLPHWVVSVQIRLVVQSRRNTVIVHFSQPTFQSNLTKTCTRSLGALCLLIRIYQNYGSLQLQWQRLSWQIMEFQVNKWRKKNTALSMQFDTYTRK